jgi:hypothetical protein
MLRRTRVADAAAAVVLCIASLAWQRANLQTGATVLAQYDCGHDVLVEHGFKVHCSSAAKRGTDIAVTSLAVKRQHTDLAQAHNSWCDRWCVLERTNADCSSCVEPSFPGLMARMKASERLSEQGWGIRIPLSVDDAPQKSPVKAGAPSAEQQAVAGRHAAPSPWSLGDLTLEEQSASLDVMNKDAVPQVPTHFRAGGKQALYQLHSDQRGRSSTQHQHWVYATSKEQDMASMERSEEADERRLLADEQRLERDRAIKQRLMSKRRLLHDRRKRQSQMMGGGMATFLASRKWHPSLSGVNINSWANVGASSPPAHASHPHLSAIAPTTPPPAVVGAAASPIAAGRRQAPTPKPQRRQTRQTRQRKSAAGSSSHVDPALQEIFRRAAYEQHKDAKDNEQERLLIRHSIENNLDPRKGAQWLEVHLKHKVKLPKLSLTPEYSLPGESVGGLWSAGSGESKGVAAVTQRPGELDAGRTVNVRARKRGLSTPACHNAYDCFNSLFQGQASLLDAQPSPGPKKKSQGSSTLTL